MKRFISAFILALFLIGGLLCGPNVIMAGEAIVKAVWNQIIPVTGLKEWRMLMSETSGGPYFPFITIPFVAQQIIGEYTQSVAITSPDGVSKKYYFILQAVSTFGVVSKNSNEASIVIDFEAPGKSTNLRIIIQLEKGK